MKIIELVVKGMKNFSAYDVLSLELNRQISNLYFFKMLFSVINETQMVSLLEEWRISLSNIRKMLNFDKTDRDEAVVELESLRDNVYLVSRANKEFGCEFNSISEELTSILGAFKRIMINEKLEEEEKERLKTSSNQYIKIG